LADIQGDDKILSEIAFSNKTSIEHLKERLLRNAKKWEHDEREQKSCNREDKNPCVSPVSSNHIKHKQPNWRRESNGQAPSRVEQVWPAHSTRTSDKDAKTDIFQAPEDLDWHPQNTTGQDIEMGIEAQFALKNIELVNGKVKITPRGARKLAKKALQTAIGKSVQRENGPHRIEKKGYGANRSIRSKKYEVGDEYYRIDFENTFLNAIGRNHPNKSQNNRVSLILEDFQIYEEMHQNRIISGLLIDESGSMLGNKVQFEPVRPQKSRAALETALALSELIRRDPNEILRVYLFSHVVREIPYTAILNTRFTYGAYTDIRRSLQKFRRDVSSKKGFKQVYLITDAESNSENGKHVGFETACAGVIQEALNYRAAGITLNIVMLDQNPRLKDFATALARKNLGRVLFTSPANLQGMIIENFLAARKIYNKM